MLRALLLGSLLLATSPAIADAEARGPREIEVNEPRYQDSDAQAPIPDASRIQNEGGSDGAGLCVISSLVQNGQTQGVPMCTGGKESALWKYAKRRPGGYGPGKLAAALDAIDSKEDWASYVGTDLNVLRSVLALGYPIGITYSWGDKYPGRIHHMVSAENDTPGYGMVADNNRSAPPFVDRPKHTVISQAELEARAFDGATYWLFVWTRKPAARAQALLPWLMSAAVIAGATAYSGIDVLLKGLGTVNALAAVRRYVVTRR